MKRGTALLLLADSWFNLALGMLGPIYALFVQEIGGDLLDASLAYFIFMITSGIVIYIVGLWEDKFDHKEKFIIAGYFLSSIGVALYLFVNNITMLFLTQIVLGIAQALLTPAYNALYTHYLDKNKEASEWGAMSSTWYVVTGLAAIAGGFIANSFGFKTLFVVMFFVSLISSFMSLSLLKRKKLMKKL
ncbi:MFS transporter [Candidatus Woesearchaeota archaeon]|nr:MFS transporter [Candidatus Woesearchaeota archaeon]